MVKDGFSILLIFFFEEEFWFLSGLRCECCDNFRFGIENRPMK